MNDPKKQFLDSLSKEQLRAWQDMQEEDAGGFGDFMGVAFLGCVILLTIGCVKWLLS